MELRQLEYFVAVAEERNFTRAAERVHISQSGVSAQIRQLERELGARLFERSSRTAGLTTAGKAALEHARAALDSARAMRIAVDEVGAVIRGELTVGMVTACTVTPLFDALSLFHHAHPGVEIALLEDASDRLVERVRSREMDVALVGTAYGPPDGVESILLIRDRLVAVAPDEHPLARRPRVGLAEVTSHPLVCLPTGTGIRSVLDIACRTRGIEPAMAMQASAPDAVIDLAVRGLGVAILSESMVSQRAGLSITVIDDIDVSATLSLIWSAPASPALGALLTHLRHAFGS
ncbi:MULTISPECIES: LysR substrate-binding domain-containing protein [unclassified Rhodococcus (in: high G+C Gram-positive bacteria)]|uniref:LysR family transcriptional regulator n=1 Tax=Rhodococcus sp. SJ-3 TaxID=3454628 RepID=UPI003F7A8D46